MAINRTTLAVAAVLCLLVGVTFGPQIVKLVGDIQFPWEQTTTITIPPGTEQSQFKFTPVKKDASATAVSSATVRIWSDTNADGKMQYSELGLVTESSGTYTSIGEYSIGAQYTFWAQVQAANYATAYIQMYMTGTKNSDGSAKTANVATGSSIEMVYLNDGETYAGLIGSIAWDDAADYNSTTYGTDKNVKVLTTISAADQGLASQVWSQVFYESIYSQLSSKADKEHSYWVKWDEITDVGIAKFYAPTFLGVQMTHQDAIDFGMSATDWDGHYDDLTTHFFWASESINWADLFYYTSDSAAPEGEFQFTSAIKAAGTTVATYGVGFWLNLEYDDMVSGTWGTSATYYAGTPGSDWDFTL